MAKKYVLLKDLPDCQAGFFYTQTDDKEFYVCYENLGKWSVAYKKKYVENNPSWFKEVVEKGGLIGDYERIDLLTELRDAIKKFKASKQINTTKEECKANESIFSLITEDGFKKEDGDMAWHIDACHTGVYRSPIKKGIDPFPNAKYFHSKENAEDYFKSQPQNNKERIEVEFLFMFPYGEHKGGGAYNLSSSGIIPKEKLPAIKQAIEKVLNS